MEDPILYTIPNGYKFRTPTPINPSTKARKEFDTQHNGVGRNDLCPCGSGVKFKRCCLLTKPKYAKL